jgi:hypothetical protein
LEKTFPEEENPFRLSKLFSYAISGELKRKITDKKREKKRVFKKENRK